MLIPKYSFLNCYLKYYLLQIKFFLMQAVDQTTPKENDKKKDASIQSKAITLIKETFKNQNYDKCYILINKYLKEYPCNIEVLMIKMKLEDKLQKYEQALLTCNLILFIKPLNTECHQIKLNILKNLQRYNYLSDCLVQSMKLFPNMSFT